MTIKSATDETTTTASATPPSSLAVISILPRRLPPSRGKRGDLTAQLNGQASPKAEPATLAPQSAAPSFPDHVAASGEAAEPDVGIDAPAAIFIAEVETPRIPTLDHVREPAAADTGSSAEAAAVPGDSAVAAPPALVEPPAEAVAGPPETPAPAAAPDPVDAQSADDAARDTRAENASFGAAAAPEPVEASVPDGIMPTAALEVEASPAAVDAQAIDSVASAEPAPAAPTEPPAAAAPEPGQASGSEDVVGTVTETAGEVQASPAAVDAPAIERIASPEPAPVAPTEPPAAAAPEPVEASTPEKVVSTVTETAGEVEGSPPALDARAADGGASAAPASVVAGEPPAAATPEAVAATAASMEPVVAPAQAAQPPADHRTPPPVAAPVATPAFGRTLPLRPPLRPRFPFQAPPAPEPKPRGTDIVAYWHGLRRGGSVPELIQIDQTVVAETWRNSLLLALGPHQSSASEPGAFKIKRLGQITDDVEYTPMVIDSILSLGQRAVTRKTPLDEIVSFPLSEGMARCRLVLLPLTGTGGRVDHVLCQLSRVATGPRLERRG